MAHVIYSWKKTLKVDNFATYNTIRAATVYDKIICWIWWWYVYYAVLWNMWYSKYVMWKVSSVRYNNRFYCYSFCKNILKYLMRMARVSLRTAERSMFLPVSDASGLCKCIIKVQFVVLELTVNTSRDFRWSGYTNQNNNNYPNPMLVSLLSIVHPTLAGIQELINNGILRCV